MAPTRINVEALVSQHGVEGLAGKIGVHVRTVRRWRNDGVDPSPLAADRLKGLLAAHTDEPGAKPPAASSASQSDDRTKAGGKADAAPVRPTRKAPGLPTPAPNASSPHVGGGVVPSRRFGG